MDKEREKNAVPIWEKEYLTLNEAAALYGIGINKLRDITDDMTIQRSVVLWSGRTRLIRRKSMSKFLDTKREV